MYIRYLFSSPFKDFGDHPYITSAKGLGGWVKKISFFADVQYNIDADIVDRWVQKVQKCADVLYGWSLGLASLVCWGWKNVANISLCHFIWI